MGERKKTLSKVRIEKISSIASISTHSLPCCWHMAQSFILIWDIGYFYLIKTYIISQLTCNHVCSDRLISNQKAIYFDGAYHNTQNELLHTKYYVGFCLQNKYKWLGHFGRICRSSIKFLKGIAWNAYKRCYKMTMKYLQNIVVWISSLGRFPHTLWCQIAVYYRTE